MNEPIDIEAIRKELAWVEMPESRKAINALLAEVKRLQQPLRCSCCGAPDEVHVPDPTDPRLWRIWMPDQNYPLWGTSHSKVMRRLGDD